MPHPLHLKVMGMKLMEYNALPADQREAWQKAAQQKLEQVAKNPEAYTKLTNSLEKGE